LHPRSRDTRVGNGLPALECEATVLTGTTSHGTVLTGVQTFYVDSRGTCLDALEATPIVRCCLSREGYDRHVVRTIY
jgi:hypothetical protein